MGTFFTNGASKADIISEILRESGVIDSAVANENGKTIIWTVESGNSTDPECKGQPYQFIRCHVLVYDPEGWGYKPMPEMAGPCYYSVPRSWLDKYPCILPPSMPSRDNWLSHSNEWRNEVRQQS